MSAGNMKRRSRDTKRSRDEEALAEELRQAWLQLGFAITALSPTTIALGGNSDNRDVMNDAMRAVGRAHAHLVKARSLGDGPWPELEAVLTPDGPLLALLSDTGAMLVAVRDRRRLQRAREALAAVFAARGLDPPDDLDDGRLSGDDRLALRPDPIQLVIGAVAVAAVLWFLLSR
jgi:hypothetical protein